MKQLMNLSQVHEEVRNRIRADASRRIAKIDRRLKRFSEDLPQIHLVIRPVGEQRNQWETRITLKNSSEIIATQAVKERNIHDSLRQAFDKLERRIQRHFKANRKRQRLHRKDMFNKSMDGLNSELESSIQHSEQNIFDLVLRPHFDFLRRFARREIRNLEIRGIIPLGSITVMDVIDETLLKAWEEYPTKAKDLQTDLWIMQIISTVMREKAEETAKFIPLANLVEEEGLKDDEFDPDLDSDQWWWNQVQENEDLLWEDILPGEEDSDSLSVLTYEEERRRVLEALNQLPQLQREAISLNAIEGYDVSDVADILKEHPEKIERAINDAREQLKQILGFSTSH